MPPYTLHTLIGALIRIGLLFALVFMFMAENAEARPNTTPPSAHTHSVTGAVGTQTRAKI